jgi:holliday junction DNA helicase RuvA
MIGKLRGVIDKIEEETLILDVNGVGYLVFASATTLRNLPPTGIASLHIETHVREDRIQLFGFLTESERYWFRTLNKINGCGVKTALAILSTMQPHEIGLAIEAQDKAPFARASGVGPKLAARLITELKGHVDISCAIDILPQTSAKSAIAKAPTNDAVAALVSLGYGKSEAFATISRISRENIEMATEELIRNGLRELGKATA